MLIAVHPFKNTKPLAKLNLDYHMCHFTQHFQQSDFWPTKQTLQLKHALYSPDLASCNLLVPETTQHSNVHFLNETDQ